MRATQYQLDELRAIFAQKRIATLSQIMDLMNNPSRMTIFRKLEELNYLSSYSHRGKYYTLPSIARFNSDGLWSCRDVRFSKFGNLLDTAEVLVGQSSAGFTASELMEVVQVKTKHVLLDLVQRERLKREKVDSRYVYFSNDRTIAGRQKRLRKTQSVSTLSNIVITNPNLAVEEAKAAILLFCSMLDEKQRRLYAGLESLKLGHGGNAHVAALLGMDPHTIARGRSELLQGDIDPEPIRESGGGRPSTEKKRQKS
jgi:hypothetical protein